MKLGGSSSWPYSRGETASIKCCPCPAVATRTSGIPAVPSSALVLPASPSSPPAAPMSSIMEAPAMLEDGKAPRSRRSMCLQVALYALMLLVSVSALVLTAFCLLHHKQAPGSCWAHGYFKDSPTQKSERPMSWDWELKHCNGTVKGLGQYLIIQQSGNYFIYAQLYRQKTIRESFTLYKDPDILLHKVVGQENGTINFARPFSLQKGDKLYCTRNSNEEDIVIRSQTYWGLFKM